MGEAQKCAFEQDTMKKATGKSDGLLYWMLKNSKTVKPTHLTGKISAFFTSEKHNSEIFGGFC